MALMKLCAQHGLVPPTGCPHCKQAGRARGNTRQRRDNRGRTWWRRLRQQVLDRDGHACVDCGTEATTSRPLTVDFLPGGPHTRNPGDYETRCSHCHGRRHGGQHRRADLDEAIT
jgi:hypothetical protein